MRYGDINEFQTGVAIPVFSLKSKNSEGIGDFLDLVDFAGWSKECGIDLIQILPINDTGEERSPYSARSAFALNPVYIRLDNIKGSHKYKDEIKKFVNKYEPLERCDYVEVVRFKRRILKEIYEAYKFEIQNSDKFQSWLRVNHWINNYSIYCTLKEQNEERSWVDWKKYNNPSTADLSKLWKKYIDENLYHAWMQFEAEKQLSQASHAIDKMGVKLKGDIPILVNEDSADVWSETKFFDLSKRAGAPPDMYSVTGQNWGFPCYNWAALEADDYRWWKARLGQSAKFYHAYRIDHVLGFFRIWAVPNNQVTGLLGHYDPSYSLSQSVLEGIGIPYTTIQYLTHPNYDKDWLLERLDEDLDLLNTYFEMLDNEPNRYKFKKEYDSEKKIIAYEIDEELKGKVLNVYWNRIFTPDSQGDRYYPSWNWATAAVLKTLPQHEQDVISKAIGDNQASQEDLWAENGTKLLKMMAEETDMLVCAEDLGAVPDCVPHVLNKLGIFALRIERWTRQWDQEGQPYVSPEDYPRLSVASPSCHDSSTLAGWWDEIDEDEKNYYLQTFGLEEDDVGAQIDHQFVKMILYRLAKSNSLLTIIPFQDFCKLDSSLLTNDNEFERINVPGTLDATNWTWRISPSIEALNENKKLIKEISLFVKERKNKPIWNV